MFTPINTFGFRLLRALLQREEVAELMLAPPVVFSSLALLMSASAGATRAGLARVLGMDEGQTSEVRDRRVRQLRETLALGGGVCAENTLCASGYRPLSPSFLLLAEQVFGVQIAQEESRQLLQLQSGLQVRLSFPPGGKATQIYSNHILAQRFPTALPRYALYLLHTARMPFWQGRPKQVQHLLAQVNENTWEDWREVFRGELTPHEGGIPDVSVAESIELVPILKELEVGPAITPSADFSRMMVSGNAPHLSALQHQVQLTVDRPAGEASAPLPKSPFIWLLCDEPTGLIVLLGGQA